MKLSYTTLSVQDKNIRQAVDIAKKYRLDGIELRGKGDTHISPESSPEYIRQAKAYITQAGLGVPCLSAYTKFAQPTMELEQEQAACIKTYMELAEKIGANTIRTFMGVFPEGCGEEQVRRNIVAGLNLAAEAVGNSPVKIVIETHDSMCSGAQLAPILEQVSDKVGVLLDIIHPWDLKEPIEKTWELIGNRIYHVHIKDVTATVPGGRVYSRIGEGVLPVKHIVKYLIDRGFDGFFSLEWEKSAVGYSGVSFEDQMESFVEFMRGMEEEKRCD